MPPEHGGDSTPEWSLADRLSDCRRLLCNRASSAARLNQSDIVFIFSIRLLAHLGEARPAIFPIEHCERMPKLLLWEMSESMGNHDSEVVDASSVD
jgi:hypothetical protein